jgi:hypothetical protein
MPVYLVTGLHLINIGVNRKIPDFVIAMRGSFTRESAE